MTDNEFRDRQRAATALREGLRQQAETPQFTPLTVADLTAPATRRAGSGRLVAAGLGVAAVIAALALLVPSMLGDRPIPAAPGPVETPSIDPTSTPTAPGVTGWHPTSPPPLSPRRDAVTAWVGDTYLVVGGFGDVCADSADCADPKPLVDGARYDPVTDTWRKIADAPEQVFAHAASPYPSTAVLGDTVYVLASGGPLAYRADRDRWERIPAAEDSAAIYATDRLLVSVRGFTTGDDFVRYDTFDPATGNWTTHPKVKTPAGAIAGASVVQGHLVVMAAGAEHTDTLWMTLITLSTGEVTPLGSTPVEIQRPVAAGTAGLAAWPRGDTQAWFLNLDTLDWSSVDLPARSRGLTGWNGGYRVDWYLTTENAIALRGQLYGPALKEWVEVPDLPVPDHDPVVAGGADSVLACFGVDTATFADACYLLRPVLPGPPSAAPEVWDPSTEPPGR